MSPWQPIKTAPKTSVEIVTGKEGVFGILYPLRSRFVGGKWCAHFGRRGWLSYEPQPTHWLPGADPAHYPDRADKCASPVFAAHGGIITPSTPTFRPA